ncbi:MAG: sulfite exporter TauE/SafE family protein [Phreatobacter sp.]|nr:sulfite exporter TauE/SafE family protein [Phreatobacter sp.]
MFFGVPYDQLAILAVGLLAAGAITGILAGVFGVGGGAVIVPVLYELFGVVGVPVELRMALAVGTSLAIIIPTSIRSFQAHRAKGAVDMEILRAWAIPVVLGVIVGSLLARYAPPAVFKAVFVFVAGLSAWRLLTGKELNFGTGMPGRTGMIASGGVIGVLSSLMGIGGGQLGNLVMMAYGRSIHNAVATSSGLGVLISIPGALGYIYAGWPKAAEFPAVAAIQFPFALGYVSLIGFLLFIPTSMWTAPLGARLAHSLPKRKLELSFGIFLLIVCLRFTWDLVTRGIG